MNSQQLPLTLTALRQRIALGELTAAEALQTQYEAANAGSTRWQCVTHLFDAAPPADDALPLAGVGLAHKDIFSMRGRAPHCGAAAPPRFSAQAGHLMRRLEHAGSVPMAALSMAEFASGVTGENPNLPLPVNPVDQAAAVGGSSSGSGVAVAAGICYGSLGTDTAGSVRIPAATCGILGLKTTAGLLSSQGCFPLARSLDSVGILARSALDAAQMLGNVLTDTQRKQVLPKFRPTDGTLSADDWRRLPESLPAPAQWRVSTCVSHPDPAFTPQGIHAQMLADYTASFPACATPSQVTLEAMPELVRSANIILHTEAAAVHRAAFSEHEPGLSSITRSVVLPGMAIPSLWYRRAMVQRAQHAKYFVGRYLREHDILLTPVLPRGVPDWSCVLTYEPTFNAKDLLALFSWTAFVNYLGLPAIVFPVGQDPGGRPICVQAIGRPYSEGLLLAFAYQTERERFDANGFVQRPPALRPQLSTSSKRSIHA